MEPSDFQFCSILNPQARPSQLPEGLVAAGDGLPVHEDRSDSHFLITLVPFIVNQFTRPPCTTSLRGAAARNGLSAASTPKGIASLLPGLFQSEPVSDPTASCARSFLKGRSLPGTVRLARGDRTGAAAAAGRIPPRPSSPVPAARPSGGDDSLSSAADAEGGGGGGGDASSLGSSRLRPESSAEARRCLSSVPLSSSQCDQRISWRTLGRGASLSLSCLNVIESV